MRGGVGQRPFGIFLFWYPDPSLTTISIFHVIFSLPPQLNFTCLNKAIGSSAWKKLGELSNQVQNIVSKDKESGSPCKKLTCPPGTRRLIGWSLPPGEVNGRNPRRTAGLKTFGRPAPSSACSLRPRSARSWSKSVGEPGPFCGQGLTVEKKLVDLQKWHK